ncbi:MAG: cadherin repeat domain-containing protein, partial [Ekhidna sp.]|nr:cadherin repeat domain-containing protein [Ekhidna sp.]
LSVAENSAAGTTVGTITALDADDDALTFTITAGNTIGDGSEVFALNETTGALTVKTAAPLDYETEANRTFTLTVQVSDGVANASAAVTVNVTNVNEAGKRLADKDIDLDAANGKSSDLWSDGTTLWVSNNGSGESSSDKVFAYTLADGSRDAAKDIDSLNAAGNNDPRGLWSDGTTMWVADPLDDKVYAYTLATGTRDAAKEFGLDHDNSSLRGLWSDGTTLWGTDNSDDKVYAYTLATGARDAAKEFDLDDDNSSPLGLWSDETTLWVSDFVDSRVYAYTLATGARNAAKEFKLVSSPRAFWSDGSTFWSTTSGTTINAFQLE